MPQRQLIIRQASRAMNANPGSSPASGTCSERYIDRTGRWLGTDGPESTSVDVAEHGARTACQHRGHPVTIACKPRVPHGVNTSMNRVEPTRAHTRPDLGLGKAERIELTGGDHAMLAFRELGQGARTLRGAFSGHTNG